MRTSTLNEATGKWPGILAQLGVDRKFLSPNHGPCPTCGGKDRFRFDDKDGRGTWFCSHCGAGTGIDLLMRVKGWEFRHAAKEIDAVLPGVRASGINRGRPESQKMRDVTKVWEAAQELVAGDGVDKYLYGRGIAVAPRDVRFHPALHYSGPDKACTLPAMVARVTGPDGRGVTVHRTYLSDGKKADVATPRKLMPGKVVKGAAIRLFPIAKCLGIAEGIETALSASVLFGVPVWSAINAGGLESFEPPAGVEMVVIFGDADESWTGQAAAATLAKRLVAKGLRVKVKLPPMGKDWNDVLLEGGVS